MKREPMEDRHVRNDKRVFQRIRDNRKNIRITKFVGEDLSRVRTVRPARRSLRRMLGGPGGGARNTPCSERLCIIF